MARLVSSPFGDLLKRHRAAAGLTQDALAERAGVSARAISDLERGVKHRPHRYTVHRLARGLELSSRERASFEAAARQMQPGTAAESRQAAEPLRPSGHYPTQPTSFIGRERDVLAVSSMLRSQDLSLLTLVGPGGSGKTRLALRVIGEVLDAFPDGAFFVPLASIADPALVPSALTTAVGLREGGAHSLMEALTRELRNRQLLLVLDNFEHLRAASSWVGELLAACPTVKVLVTSRSVLHMTAEHVYTVLPLALPDANNLPDFDSVRRYEAVALFVERAHAARGDFEITPPNAPDVVEICRQLDGLPLAIELAAARVRHLPLKTLRNRLTSRLQVLTGRAPDRPARQQTLRSAIEWSYNLLDTHQQRLFVSLAVFAGGCRIEQAEAVCALEGGLDTLEGASALIDQSLLCPVALDAGELRLTMLDTIREYARDRLHGTGRLTELGRQHAEAFLLLAREVAPELEGHAAASALLRFEEEHDNLRAALQWALESGSMNLGLDLAATLARFWELGGHLSEGRQWLGQMLAAVGEERSGTTRALLARALSGAGALAFAQNDATAAVGYFEQSLPLYRQMGDVQGLARALFRLGELATWQSNPLAAIAWREEAVELARSSEDDAWLARSLLELAEVVMWQGDLDRLGHLVEESLALYRRLGDPAGMAGALQLLSHIAQNQGRSERASALFEECLELVRRAGPDTDIRPRLESLAQMARSRGQCVRSMELYEESVARSLTLGDARAAAHTRCELARSAQEHGEYARAEALHRESLALFRRAHDLGGIGFALVGLGAIARDLGDAKRGEELGEESLRLFQDLGDKGYVAWSLHNLGLAARHRGNYQRARALLAESLAIFRTYGHKSPLAQVLGSIGLVELDRGDDGSAQDAFAESLAVAGPGGSRWLLAMDLEGMAGVAGRRGQPALAARLFGAADALRQEIGAPIWPAFRPLYEQRVRALRSELGHSVFSETWTQGALTPLPEAIELALHAGRSAHSAV
jgi:predicted ATPase/transcriptional regulator with XRE-family HTH domain